MGSPWELLEGKGMFYNMVKHTGNDADKILRKAKAAFKGECATSKK